MHKKISDCPSRCNNSTMRERKGVASWGKMLIQDIKLVGEDINKVF